METSIKNTGIAAFCAVARERSFCGGLASDLAYGAFAPAGGDVVMPQVWRGLNEAIKGGTTVLGGKAAGIADPVAHHLQAPVVRRTVLAPHPERPPV
jgi:hypothetical protein